MRNTIYILLFLISFNGLAQEKQAKYADVAYYLVDSLELNNLAPNEKLLVDSCLNIYHNTTLDTEKINAIENIVEECWDDRVWPKYNFWLLDLLKNNKEKFNTKNLNLFYLKSYASALSNVGFYNQNNTANLSEAIDYYRKALDIYKSIHNKEGIALSLNNIGLIYNELGDIPKALKYFHKSLSIAKELGDKSQIANYMNNIGYIYDRQNHTDEALDFYNQSLAIRITLNDEHGIAESLNNIAVIYNDQGKIDLVLDYLNQSMEIQKKIGDLNGLATSYNNLATIYKDNNEKEKGLEYYFKALALREQIGEMRGVANTLMNIGKEMYDQGNYSKAEAYGVRSLESAQEIGYPLNIERAAHLLSEVYEQLGKGMKALEMYKLHIQMRDSINNEETQKATIKQQTQYEFEKAQIVKENEAKEQARLLEESTTRRNNLQYSLIFLGILLLFGMVLSLGFIKVSPNIAEGLIFFSFLIMFEFILVFTDPYLQDITHDEPMYNLAANALIALLIFPLHAVLERLLKKRIVK